MCLEYRSDAQPLHLHFIKNLLRLTNQRPCKILRAIIMHMVPSCLCMSHMGCRLRSCGCGSDTSTLTPKANRPTLIRQQKLVWSLNRIALAQAPLPCIIGASGPIILQKPMPLMLLWRGHQTNKQTNKNLRCGNRKGLLGRNDQTHHRMGPKTMESIPPSKRNTQADIQLRTRQTNHQQETDGCIQIKHNPEHQPSRMSRKSTAYVPPKTTTQDDKNPVCPAWL